MPRTAKRPPELDVVLFSSLLPDQVSWLWPGRIPLGKLTVISGQPGLGKSLLALDIAARVTRGGDWPDSPSPAPAATNTTGNPIENAVADNTQRNDTEQINTGKNAAGQSGTVPSIDENLAWMQLVLAGKPVAPVPLVDTVLLLNAEDHLGDSVSPSLAAAKANFRGIVGIKGIYSQDRHFKAPPQGIDLLKHLPLLRKQLKETRGVRLMVIDPFLAYWGKISRHPTKATHRVATELAALAAEFNIAIIVITDSRHTGLPCRNSWTVKRSWEDDDLRVWTSTQFHYGPRPIGLGYRVQKNHILWETGPLDIPRNTDGTVQKLTVTEWLSYFLSGGPREATEAYTTGEALGFSQGQVRRAKEQLRVTLRKRTGEEYGKWTWELP